MFFKFVIEPVGYSGWLLNYYFMGLLTKDTSRIYYDLPNGQSDSMSIKGSDNIAQFKEALMANQWNFAMAQEQNAWNLEQWNRENDYNSPSAQLQRLKDAGINPLMLDKWQNASAQSPSAADAQATLAGYTPHEALDLQKMQQAIDASHNAQSNSLDWLRLQNEQSRLRLDTAMNEEQLKAVRAGVDLTQSQKRGQDVANKRAYSDYTMTSGNDFYRREFLNNMRYQNVSHRNLIYRQQMENEVYRATMSDLKRMPKYQVKKLLVDMKIAGEQGKYLEFQNTLRDKYHIDPNSDVWTNLLYMGLRDPQSYAKIVSSIAKAFKSSGKTIMQKVREYLPDSSSVAAMARSSID